MIPLGSGDEMELPDYQMVMRNSIEFRLVN